MAASRSTHCSPRAASPSSDRNAGPGTVVLRAWPRSTATNSTWLNLIGIWVGQQLRCEIIEGLQFPDRFQELISVVVESGVSVESCQEISSLKRVG
jgi:hypothetical protein